MWKNYFAADPIPHWKDADTYKERFISDWSRRMQKLFGLNKKQVLNLSCAYRQRSDALQSFLWLADFLVRCEATELKKNSTILYFLVWQTIAENLYPEKLKKSSKKQRGDSEDTLKLARFLQRNLDRSDKVKLLDGFLFARSTNNFPLRPFKHRHLVFRSVVKGNRYLPDYCDHNGNCGCRRWLEVQSEVKLDKCIKNVARKFYQMRCAVVHDAASVDFFHLTVRPSDISSWSFELINNYSRTYRNKNKRKLRTRYSVYLNKKEVRRILLEGFKKSFESGLPMS